MAKSGSTKAVAAPHDLDLSKFENIHQVGGIQTGTIDTAGPGTGCRVAQVNTGAGLRYTVAIDRGGDITEAFFNQHSLAYLSPNPLLPPNHAYSHGMEWLRGWAGGLVTSCGPEFMGGPRKELDYATPNLHGRYSNIPAAIEMIVNPDPHRGSNDMLLSLITRDSRMFGPVIEVRRHLRSTLGVNQIIIHDKVINRGNHTVAHNWLYHVNLGYPLIDKGTKLIYRGSGFAWDKYLPEPHDEKWLNNIKTISDALPHHQSVGEHGSTIDVTPDADGICRIGAINAKLKLGFEISYPSEQLPRIANWQHLGPRGSYVTGLEPFSGSLFGLDVDKHPKARVVLEPGEEREYYLTLNVLTTPAEFKALQAYDGKVTMKK